MRFIGEIVEVAHSKFLIKLTTGKDTKHLCTQLAENIEASQRV